MEAAVLRESRIERDPHGRAQLRKPAHGVEVRLHHVPFAGALLEPAEGGRHRLVAEQRFDDRHLRAAPQEVQRPRIVFLQVLPDRRVFALRFFRLLFPQAGDKRQGTAAEILELAPGEEARQGDEAVLRVASR